MTVSSDSVSEIKINYLYTIPKPCSNIPMRLIFLLVLNCSLGSSLLAQTKPASNYNEAVVNAFEKVLRKKKEEWSKNNYNSIVYVPDADMKKAVIFSQIKATSFDSVQMLLNIKDTVRKFMYFCPAPADTVYSKADVQMKFPTGGYSCIEEANLAKSITYKGDTIIYKTDSAKWNKYPNAYGIRIVNSSNGSKFDARLSYAWYLPEGYEYISYSCNKNGRWQRRGSLIHFVGDFDETNFLFDIRFRKQHIQPTMLMERKVAFSKTVPVKADHVNLFIHDAQVQDGDIISLNLNGEWIIRGLEVTKEGAKITIPLSYKENYLIMHAENLGTIPPNTATMQINDGSNTHRITLNSDAGKSEGIVLVRQ
jgi:hypothetical protein